MTIHKVFFIIKKDCSYHKCVTCKTSYCEELEFKIDHLDYDVDVTVYDLRRLNYDVYP